MGDISSSVGTIYLTSPLGLEETIRTVHVYSSLLGALNATLKKFPLNQETKDFVIAQEDMYIKEADLQSKQLASIIDLIYYTSAGKSKMHKYAAKSKAHLKSQLTDLSLQASQGTTLKKMITSVTITAEQFKDIANVDNPFQSLSKRSVKESLLSYSLENPSLNEKASDQAMSDFIIKCLENYVTTGEFLTHDYNVGNDLLTTKNRSKRQILELFSGILGGAGLVMSSLNRIELEQLKTAMQGEEGQINTLHKEIRLNTQSISLIHRNLKQVIPLLIKVSGAMTKANAGEKVSVLLIYMDNIKTHCQRLLDNLNHQVDCLMHHSLSSRWNHKTQLDLAITKLKNAAEQRNMVLYDNSAYSLFRFKANLVLFNGKPKIVLKVPIRSRQATFQVFSYKNLPFLIGDLKYELRTSHQILLAGHFDVLFKSLTQEQWRNCMVFKNTKNFWFCPSLDQIYEKSSGTSCLIKLYKGETKHIKRFCDFKVSSLKERIVQISHSKFHIIPLQIPTIINVKCNNIHENTQHSLSIPTTIELPINCRGLTSDHSFSSSFSFEVESSIKPKMIELQPEIFLDFLASGNENMKTLKTLVSKLESINPLEDINMSKLEDEYLKYTNQVSSSLYSYRTEILLVIFILLAVILICIEVFRCKRTKTGSGETKACCGSLTQWCCSCVSSRHPTDKELSDFTEENKAMVPRKTTPSAPASGPTININTGPGISNNNDAAVESFLDRAAAKLGAHAKISNALNLSSTDYHPPQIIRNPQVARGGD